jgi:peptidoglycan/LPS O-acetylase OafA/YrhL
MMTLAPDSQKQTPNSADRFRPEINGLRALAVVLVVLFHFQVPGFSGGFIGVDVFFVISGYLMTAIVVRRLLEDRFSLIAFYLARARRIVPALAVLCVLLLVGGWLALGPLDYATLARHAASAVVFVSNFVFWQEAGYFDVTSQGKWLLHTWSLSVEWQFYLLYPIGLMIVWRLRPTRAALAVTIGAMFLLSLAVSVIATPLRRDAAYFLLPTRAWELLAGALVFMFLQNLNLRQSRAQLLEWAGLLLILGSALLLSARDLWPGHLAIVPVAGTALVIAARNAGSPLMNNPVSQFLGSTSYSIYLWHWPVVVALNLKGFSGIGLWIVVGFILTILFGWLSFRFVETPGRLGMGGGLRESSWVPIGAATIFALALAGLVYANQGFSSRLGAQERSYQAVASAVNDWGHPGPNCKKKIYATQCESGGDRVTRLIMFIGDSHVQQFYPRYASRTSRNHDSTLFVTQAGCLPMRGIETRSAGKNCGRFAELAWREVSNRRPSKLVISSIWTTYFFNSSGGFKGGICVQDSAGCTPVTDRRQLQAAFSVFAADVSRAVAAGTDVYIVGPMPPSEIDYPKVKMVELVSSALPLSIYAHSGRAPAAPTYTFDQSSDSPEVIIDNILLEIAEESAASLVQPEQFLCSQGVCPLTDQSGAPIYRDSNHLRQSFVRSPALNWLDTAIGIEE